jgi:hypothetical protein
VYAWAFAAALVVAGVLLVDLAIAGFPEHRGPFIALAVIWVPMAAGAVWLVVVTERRLRGARAGGHLT